MGSYIPKLDGVIATVAIYAACGMGSYGCIPAGIKDIVLLSEIKAFKAADAGPNRGSVRRKRTYCTVGIKGYSNSGIATE